MYVICHKACCDETVITQQEGGESLPHITLKRNAHSVLILYFQELKKDCKVKK